MNLVVGVMVSNRTGTWGGSSRPGSPPKTCSSFILLKLEGKDDAASNFSEGEAMQRDFRQCGFQVIGRTQISDIYAYPLGELRNFLVERFNRKDLFTHETMRYYHMYVKTLLGPSKSTPKDHWSRI